MVMYLSGEARAHSRTRSLHALASTDLYTQVLVAPPPIGALDAYEQTVSHVATQADVSVSMHIGDKANRKLYIHVMVAPRSESTLAVHV